MKKHGKNVMKFREVISRIAEFNVPIFGVSWNPPQGDTIIARRVLAFLEDRHVLYRPYYLEVEDQCFSSATEVRKFLIDIIGELEPGSKLRAHLRRICASCRVFLDEANPVLLHIHRPQRNGRRFACDSYFFTQLSKLRTIIGFHVAAIAVMNGLNVEGDLIGILPAESEDEDS